MTKRQLVSPSAACDLVAKHFDDPKMARAFLLRYAESGAVYVAADKTFAPNKQEAPNKRISAATLKQRTVEISEEFWTLGVWNNDGVEYFGIQFDENDVSNVATKHAPKIKDDPAPQTIEEVAAPRSPSKGGRPNGKHGEPIAALVLRYMGSPRAELNRLTGPALEKELKQEYIDRGFAAPSRDNRESICVGIIRAIKRHQDEVEDREKA